MSAHRPRPSQSTERLLAEPAHKEARLVFLLAGPRGARDVAPLIGPDTDWHRLLQIAWSENAIGALREYCRQLHPGAIPLGVARELACLALKREFSMRKLERRLDESLAALEEAGIEIVMLKGAALVATVYGSFAARSMNDLDLLVDPRQANEAQAIMRTVGWETDPSVPDHAAYAGHHHLPPLKDSRGSGLRVEIHRALLPTGHPFGLGVAELWREARRVSISGRGALVLQPNHHALHLAIHFAWSHMMRAGAWHAFHDLCTLDQAGLIDWDELVRLALRTGASTCCYWMLRLGQTVSNLSVPERVFEALVPPLNPGLLNRVERHLVNILFQRDAAHLSARLDRALWSLAIRPRALGHGDSRPWSVSTALATARQAGDSASGGGMEPPVRHVVKVRMCSSYLASLMWA